MAIKKLKAEYQRREREAEEMIQKDNFFNIKESGIENTIATNIEPVKDVINLNKNSTKVINSSNSLDRKIVFSNGIVTLPRKSKIATGEYVFQILSIAAKEDIHGEFGLYDQFIVTFFLYQYEDEEPLKLSIPYTISTNPKSSLMLFLTSFSSLFKDQGITIRQLVGLKGTCIVHHHTTKLGDEYERLTIKKVVNLITIK